MSQQFLTRPWVYDENKREGSGELEALKKGNHVGIYDFPVRGKKDAAAAGFPATAASVTQLGADTNSFKITGAPAAGTNSQKSQ